jgi:hypothetical protein
MKWVAESTLRTGKVGVGAAHGDAVRAGRPTPRAFEHVTLVV